MKHSASRESILRKVREALIHTRPVPFPALDMESSVYPEPQEPLDVLFAREFTKVSGKFVFCENESELSRNLAGLVKEKQWRSLACREEELRPLLKGCGEETVVTGGGAEHADAGLTRCEALVARTGSVLVSSLQASGRSLSVLPPAHAVVAYTTDLVFDIRDALARVADKYGSRLPSMISLITGPSRTADIEKTLVLGAHGPKEIYVFLVDKTVH